jgi:hypothetical protein
VAVPSKLYSRGRDPEQHSEALPSYDLAKTRDFGTDPAVNGYCAVILHLIRQFRYALVPSGGHIVDVFQVITQPLGGIWSLAASPQSPGLVFQERLLKVDSAF